MHLRQGHKKGHVFRPGYHAGHVCHSAYCGFPNIQSKLSGYGHASEMSNGTKHVPTHFQL